MKEKKVSRWQALFDWLHDIATMLKTNGQRAEYQYTTIQNEVHIGQQHLEDVYARLDILIEQVEGLAHIADMLAVQGIENSNKPCTCTCPQPYRYWYPQGYWPYGTWCGDATNGTWAAPTSGVVDIRGDELMFKPDGSSDWETASFSTSVQGGCADTLHNGAHIEGGHVVKN